MSAEHKELLRNLIDQQLWLSKGKELGITGETELIKRLDEIRKQYNLESIDDLEKAAKEQGVSFEDFKANIRNQIITQDVMRQEVGEHVQITPGEAERYYEQHKQEYTQPESERLSEILISTASADDPAKVAAAKAKADDIEARLHAGGDFAQLARSFSEGTTAAQGGDLGQYKRGQLPKVLEDQTFDLKAGQYTDPILTRQGYIVLKVVQHTPGGPRPYKEVQQDVEEAFYMSQMEPAIRAYLTKMREDAFIDIKPGYVDTGASPNETKPVYSAYVPPAPKKKAKVERTRFRESTRTFRQKSGAAASAPEQPRACACDQDKRQEGRSGHGEAGQEGKDSLWAGAARDVAHGSGEFGHGECGCAAGDGFEYRAAGQSARGRHRTDAEDALQRPRADGEEDQNEWSAGGCAGARAAGCGRGRRPPDAVGSFGAFGPDVNE